MILLDGAASAYRRKHRGQRSTDRPFYLSLDGIDSFTRPPNETQEEKGKTERVICDFGTKEDKEGEIDT